MKPDLKTALHSRDFARDVASLAFLFAGLNTLFGTIGLLAGSTVEVVADAIGVLFAGAIFAVLGWFTRRGSRAALYITIGMFVLDVVFLLVMPPSRGFAGALLARGFMLGLLVRNLRRLRTRVAQGAL